MCTGVPRTVSVSYTIPGLSNVFPWYSVARYIAYARSILGFSVDEDCFAASELERLLYEASLTGRYVGYRELCRLLDHRVVCVAGGSESLEHRLDRVSGSCDTVVAVDGSTTLLLRHGVKPSIIVGDLDGRWSDLLEASKTAVVLAHAHGDNTATIRALIPLFERVAGVSQCEHVERLYTLPPIGFTDGDKAVGLVLLCSSIADIERLELYGMNFDERVGWWSKPWLRESVEPWDVKRVKLGIGRKLVNLFISRLRGQGVEVVSY